MFLPKVARCDQLPDSVPRLRSRLVRRSARRLLRRLRIADLYHLDLGLPAHLAARLFVLSAFRSARLLLPRGFVISRPQELQAVYFRDHSFVQLVSAFAGISISTAHAPCVGPRSAAMVQPSAMRSATSAWRI